MDQSLICGVGNYIKADSLWLAQINPHKAVKDLSDTQLITLNSSIKQVLRESFSSGGATIKNYKNLNDEIGDYSARFMVYNRTIDPNGNQVIKELTPDGR